MKKQKTRMLVIAMLVFTMLLAMTACAAKQQAVEDTASSQLEVTENEATMPEDGTVIDEQFGQEPETGKTFTIGICNYVDDASLNQIVENIQNV